MTQPLDINYVLYKLGRHTMSLTFTLIVLGVVAVGLLITR
jgi:hypothetical protein